MYVTDAEGETVNYKMTSSDTVWDLKNVIQEKTSQSADAMTLFLKTKLLENKTTLVTCGIKKWTYLDIGMYLTKVW